MPIIKVLMINIILNLIITYLQHHGESHITNITITMEKEFAENIRSEDKLISLIFNIHNRLDSLVENSITSHARTISLHFNLEMSISIPTSQFQIIVVVCYSNEM